MILKTTKHKLAEIVDRRVAKTLSEEYGAAKDVSFIRKGLEPTDVIFEPQERAAVSTITSSRPDRDREIVRPDGLILDHYRKNPVVLPGHHYGGLPIGKNIWIKASEGGDSLIGKTVYSDTALGNEYYEYRKAGFPMATSIGFIPLEYYEKGTKGFNAHAKDMESKGWITEDHLETTDRIFTKSILLEYSDVAVPSNPDALTIAVSKGFCPDGKCSVVEWGVEERKQIESIIVDTEDIEAEDIEAKKIEQKDQPSVSDIKNAIASTLNDGAQVAELYPADYPNGRVVIEHSVDSVDGAPASHQYIDWDYEYDEIKKEATLVSPTEVTEQWASKHLEEKKAVAEEIKSPSFKIVPSRKPSFTLDQADQLAKVVGDTLKVSFKDMMSTEIDSLKKDLEKQIALAKGQVYYE